jgi:hypothetical protein
MHGPDFAIGAWIAARHDQNERCKLQEVLDYQNLHSKFRVSLMSLEEVPGRTPKAVLKLKRTAGSTPFPEKTYAAEIYMVIKNG